MFNFVYYFAKELTDIVIFILFFQTANSVKWDKTIGIYMFQREKNTRFT